MQDATPMIDLSQTFQIQQHDTNYQIVQPFKPTRLVFYGPDQTIYFEIDFSTDPPTINLHGHIPDESGKVFWNVVSNLIHRPAMFPEVETKP